ncbi:13084_t:CDS:2 [Funneliformis geosporum]|uniref:10_t:CDS:1 n=1 Tax=Funneliformis geosporum TaxID=1117311 RepID=A0A9W4WT32_9GLOM|nr:13084_t:CDS:2 [Funneliformis geosporum]CAI2176673.1 10_t:CDS:2 [Funneliformis geosporum]
MWLFKCRATKNGSVILGYNFRDSVEGIKLYKSVIDSGAMETTLPYYIRSTLGRKGWNNRASLAESHVDSSLVGTDVLDQFFFVYEPTQGFKLRESDEASLISDGKL